MSFERSNYRRVTDGLIMGVDVSDSVYCLIVPAESLAATYYLSAKFYIYTDPNKK